MLTFFIGLWLGGVVGVITMCLVQVNRRDEARWEEDPSQFEPERQDQGK